MLIKLAAPSDSVLVINPELDRVDNFVNLNSLVLEAVKIGIYLSIELIH